MAFPIGVARGLVGYSRLNGLLIVAMLIPVFSVGAASGASIAAGTSDHTLGEAKQVMAGIETEVSAEFADENRRTQLVYQFMKPVVKLAVWTGTAGLSVGYNHPWIARPLGVIAPGAMIGLISASLYKTIRRVR